MEHVGMNVVSLQSRFKKYKCRCSSALVSFLPREPFEDSPHESVHENMFLPIPGFEPLDWSKALPNQPFAGLVVDMYMYLKTQLTFVYHSVCNFVSFFKCINHDPFTNTGVNTKASLHPQSAMKTILIPERSITSQPMYRI